MKRILSIVLSLVMILTYMPVMAFAADDVAADDSTPVVSEQTAQDADVEATDEAAPVEDEAKAEAPQEVEKAVAPVKAKENAWSIANMELLGDMMLVKGTNTYEDEDVTYIYPNFNNISLRVTFNTEEGERDYYYEYNAYNEAFECEAEDAPRVFEEADFGIINDQYMELDCTNTVKMFYYDRINGETIDFTGQAYFYEEYDPEPEWDYAPGTIDSIELDPATMFIIEGEDTEDTEEGILVHPIFTAEHSLKITYDVDGDKVEKYFGFDDYNNRFINTDDEEWQIGAGDFFFKEDSDFSEYGESTKYVGLTDSKTGEDKYFEVTVDYIENPVVSLEFSPVSQKTVSKWELDSMWNEDFFNIGDVLTVNMKDGTTESYTFDNREDGYGFYSENGSCLFVSENGVNVDRDWSFELPDDAESADVECTIEWYGKSTTFYITVTQNKYVLMTINGNIKKVPDYMYMADEVYLEDVIEEGSELVLTDREGNEKTYVFTRDEMGEFVFVDEDGNTYNRYDLGFGYDTEYIYGEEVDYDLDRVPAWISWMGMDYNFTFAVTESPYESISLTNNSPVLYEYELDSDGYLGGWKLLSEGAVLTLKCKDGSTEKYTYDGDGFYNGEDKGVNFDIDGIEVDAATLSKIQKNGSATVKTTLRCVGRETTVSATIKANPYKSIQYIPATSTRKYLQNTHGWSDGDEFQYDVYFEVGDKLKVTKKDGTVKTYTMTGEGDFGDFFDDGGVPIDASVDLCDANEDSYFTWEPGEHGVYVAAYGLKSNVAKVLIEEFPVVDVEIHQADAWMLNAKTKEYEIDSSDYIDVTLTDGSVRMNYVGIEDGWPTFRSDDGKYSISLFELRSLYFDDYSFGCRIVKDVTLFGIDTTVEVEYPEVSLDFAEFGAKNWEELLYDGKPKTPEFYGYIYNTETGCLDEIEAGKDFEVVEYTDNINAGIAIAHIVGAEGSIYEGQEVDVPFEIMPVSIIATISMSKTSFNYSGSNINTKSSITVKDTTTGKVIPASEYTVRYTKNAGGDTVSDKYVGPYNAEIVWTGNYRSTKPLYKAFKIIPKGTSIKKLTKGKKSFKVTWKKQSTQTTGYQIRYSLKSSMSGAKTVTVSKTSTTSKTIKKLKAKKKYYVQIRTYKTVNGTKYYSSWSSKKTVKTK